MRAAHAFAAAALLLTCSAAATLMWAVRSAPPLGLTASSHRLALAALEAGPVVVAGPLRRAEAAPSPPASTPASPPASPDDSALADRPAPAPPRADGDAAPDPASDAPAPRWKLGTTVGVIYAPASFQPKDGGFDLFVHFHGATHVIQEGVARVGLDAVLLTVNLGTGSGRYERAYEDGFALQSMLELVERVVARKEGLAHARVKRLAIGGWSAGYGAVGKILATDKGRERVDAVLLEDGLHVARGEGASTIDELRIAPFERFARDAQEGKRLMVITHSSVETTEYASTTETALHLIDELDVPVSTPRGGEPAGMGALYQASEGGLSIEGFDGKDERAHCDHLLRVSETVLPRLKDWWRREAPPAGRPGAARKPAVAQAESTSP